MSATLRRLIDLPGVKELEFKAVLKPAMREPESRAEFPEIDDCVSAAFGLTTDEAQAARPADWDGVDDLPLAALIDAFRAEGWDVTDDKRKPLKVLVHFSLPLWLALRGVAGELPFQADTAKPEGWVSNLEREAARFRKR